MMNIWSESATSFFARLLAGGTFELVVLVILCVLAIIAAVVLAWIAWKILVAGAKGATAATKGGNTWARERIAARRERRLAMLPKVAASWTTRRNTKLRSVLNEAGRRAGNNALRIVVVSDTGGFAELCAGLDLATPGPARCAVAAGDGLILVDASQADIKDLRALVGALPRGRPLDGVAAVMDEGAIPGDTLARAAVIAQASAMEVGLHVVAASTARGALWAIVERETRDGRALCESVVRDAARWWLGGGTREGLEQLGGPLVARVAQAIDRAIATAPTPSVHIASLCVGGRGLAKAVAQSAGLTRPARTANATQRVAQAGCVGLGALIVASAAHVTDTSRELGETVDTAAREARTAWLHGDVESVPGPARIHRVVNAARRLDETSKASILAPLSVLTPDAGNARELGAALIESYILQPLGTALKRRIDTDLEPDADARAWVKKAQRVDEWVAAWEGLSENAEEVDVATLLTEGFGDPRDAWPENAGELIALDAVEIPAPERGGLDTDAVRSLANERFIATMQQWAHATYSQGPVARASATIAHERSTWEERRQALRALDEALHDNDQRWLTSPEDNPDYGYEAWIYGRALATALLGIRASVEAKAATSTIRIAARKSATTVSVQGLGPILTRSSAGTQGGATTTLSLSRAAAAWLDTLERFHHTGAGAALDETRTHARMPRGRITIDGAAVQQAGAKVREFERVASAAPQALPAQIFEETATQVGADIERVVLAEIEAAVQSAPRSNTDTGSAPASEEVEHAIAAIGEIEAWLSARGARQHSADLRAIRARLAATVIEDMIGDIETRDPIAVHFDAGADPHAMVRRFERGVSEIERTAARHGPKNAALAAEAGGEASVQWERIAQDLKGYRAGDPTSALTALSGMIHAYANNPDEACSQPRSTHAVVRDDYIARTLRRYVENRARSCDARKLAYARNAYHTLSRYYETHVAGLWPYSDAAAAPEIGAALLGEFVQRIGEHRQVLDTVDGRYSRIFDATSRLWSDPEEPTAIEFRVRWRPRPGEEVNAHHVADFSIDGTESDADGVHRWRYGAPFALRLRLAKNSEMRFAVPNGANSLEHRATYPGNAAFLRTLEAVGPTGAWTLRDGLVDSSGQHHDLHVSVDIEHRDGAPLKVPSLRTPGATRTGGVDRVVLKRGATASATHDLAPMPSILR